MTDIQQAYLLIFDRSSFSHRMLSCSTAKDEKNMLVSSRLNQIESPRQLGLRKWRKKKLFNFLSSFDALCCCCFCHITHRWSFHFLLSILRLDDKIKAEKLFYCHIESWEIRRKGRWEKETNGKKNRKKQDNRRETWPMINEKFNATMTWIFSFSCSLVSLFYFISWYCRMSNSFYTSYFFHLHKMKYIKIFFWTFGKSFFHFIFIFLFISHLMHATVPVVQTYMYIYFTNIMA